MSDKSSLPALVDSWIRDSRIRRDFLIGLALVLLAVVLMVVLLSQNSAVQIGFGAAGAAGAAWGGRRVARARRR